MLIYYEDDILRIGFSNHPHVDFRYPCPGDTQEQKQEKLSKPFINLQEITISIRYIKNKIPYEYRFSIPKDYTWDGATIPRIFWRLIGSKTDPRFMVASMVHDILCENHELVANDRYLSTLVLEKLCQSGGTNAFTRWLMKHSVDNYQKVKGKWNE